VELRDTGVILQVTPRVNQNGVVTLDIAQEVSDVARTTTSGINSPTIQQRRLTSTVATRSGQVVALGGLIRERATRTRSGVPLLSQIPIIGAAFGAHANGGSRTELIILLKPTVIRSPDEVKGMVDALIDGLEVAGPLVEKAQSREVAPPVREPNPRPAR
jgi:general secretion pathway protein D